MTVIAVGWRNHNKHSIFNQATLAQVLPQLRCISEIQDVGTDFAAANLNHLFTVYFSRGVSMDFGFSTAQDALLARQDLISKAILYWGKDQVIFSNGFYYDVVVVPAIESLTDVFSKERKAGFAAVVRDVPYPIHFVFQDLRQAQEYWRQLNRTLESLRQGEGRDRFKKVAVA